VRSVIGSIGGRRIGIGNNYPGNNYQCAAAVRGSPWWSRVANRCAEADILFGENRPTDAPGTSAHGPGGPATGRRKGTKDRTLRVLLLEDRVADAELVVEALRASALPVEAERVDSEAEFVAALERFRPDVVVSDHSLASFNAPAALRVLRARRPGTPLIVVTGVFRADVAVECLRAGAEDLLLKENLGRLPQAIEEALRVREPLERLSPRQLQVLRLIAQGSSTPAIARELQLSAKTVETHRAELMRRVGIHDLVGLVRYAVRVGLLPLDR
jgi:DNA-binding NarL/FixJ family response regulator